MFERRIVIADELDATTSEARARSEFVQRVGSDLSVLLEIAADLLFVRRISEYLQRRGHYKPTDLVMDDQQKFKTKIHNLQRPGDLIIKVGWPVEEITRHMASAKNAEALVVGTRASRGVERFFLGSVAEELIRVVRRPIVIVGPEVQAVRYHLSDFKQHHFVVATDLTKKSRGAETYAVSLAKRLNAKVTLYYNLAETIESVSRFNYGAGEVLPTINTVIADIRKDAKNEIEKKATRLRAMGIDCDIYIEDSKPEIGDSLSQLCENKSILFMGHRSRGIIASTIIGSNVRSVVTRSQIPVAIVKS